MAALFTIIIPTYNRARMLPKAIGSVVEQTFADWELIVVDDGSTDNTKEVVSKFDDRRIKYIYQKNAERCAARNNGIANASGQYICFLDSDDYYLKERLNLLSAELLKRNYPVAMLYTGLTIDNGNTLIRRSEVGETDKSIFDKIALSVIHSQQACIHREVLAHFKYDTRFYIGEDMELWLRIATQYPISYVEDQFTIVTVDHEDRSVNVKRFNSYVQQLRLFSYIFSADHPGNKISPELKASLLANAYFGVAKYCIYNNRRWEAALNVAKAIFADHRSNQLKFRTNVMVKLISFASMEKVQELINF